MKVFYKVMNNKMNHNGKEYKYGNNTLDGKFDNDSSKECCDGRLYVSDHNNIKRYLSYGTDICLVFVPNNAKIIKLKYKWGVDRFILICKYPINDINTIEKFDLYSGIKQSSIKGDSKVLNNDNLSIMEVQKYKKQIDWKIVSENPNIKGYILHKYRTYLDWDKVSRYNLNLTMETIHSMKNLIKWRNSNIMDRLNNDFIDNHLEYIGSSAYKYFVMDEKYINDNIEDINWEYALDNPCFKNIDMTKFVIALYRYKCVQYMIQNKGSDIGFKYSSYDIRTMKYDGLFDGTPKLKYSIVRRKYINLLMTKLHKYEKEIRCLLSVKQILYMYRHAYIGKGKKIKV